MRKVLWLTLSLYLPPVAYAQVQPDTRPMPAVRVMAIEPTQTVQFNGSLPQLRERLHLSDAQQTAWARYAGSVSAYTRLFFEEKPQSDFPGEAAPRQLERMNARIRARTEALQTIETEARALYAELRAEQQATADQHLLATIPVFGFLPPTR